MAYVLPRDASRVPLGTQEVSFESEGYSKIDRLEAVIASAFRVPASDLHARTRGAAEVARARQVAMYLAHVEFGLSFAEIGRAFGRTRTTAARACRQIEDLRTDRSLDARITRLEFALRRKTPPFGGVAQ